MKFCTKCGAELADGAVFCSACGNPCGEAQPIAQPKESNNRVCSILSLIFGIISFLPFIYFLFVIFFATSLYTAVYVVYFITLSIPFNIAGIVLGIIGLCKKGKKVLPILGLCFAGFSALFVMFVLTIGSI